MNDFADNDVRNGCEITIEDFIDEYGRKMHRHTINGLLVIEYERGIDMEVTRFIFDLDAKIMRPRNDIRPPKLPTVRAVRRSRGKNDRNRF